MSAKMVKAVRVWLVLLAMAIGAVSVCGPQQFVARGAALPPVSHDAPSRHLAKSLGNLPLSFEVNAGQADAHVKFLSRGQGYTLFLTGDEAVLGPRQDAATAGTRSDQPRRQAQNRLAAAPVALRLVGADAHAAVLGSDELPGKVNYFIGNDPRNWRSNVPTYAKVRYRNVYPGIDLVYYGNRDGQLEYDFIVAPAANPGSIALAVSPVHEPQRAGADARLEIAQNGDLIIPAEGGELALRKPLIYQQKSQNSGPRRIVEGNFRLDAQNHVRFELGPYDRSQPLVIDPTLVYSTYLGGSDYDYGQAIAVDSSGDAYVTGYTDSPNFPTASPEQGALGGTTNAFVTKLNPTGTVLLYSTYIGGNRTDNGLAIAVDSAGDAYITGKTSSTNFPTQAPYQASLAGSYNAFVAELNPSGSALVYSTYLGGSGMNGDGGLGIALDASGNAYVTGVTTSSNFPTANPLFPTLSGAQNAFITKLSWNGSALSLVYSTYLGGNKSDSGNGIAVDSSGNAYITGKTNSTNFPTSNPVQAQLSIAAASNAFVTELNATGSALIYSTYLGGGKTDQANGIAVDSAGGAYITGYTDSQNFPVANAYQGSLAGTYNAFVAKLEWSGSALSLPYSTYLGGDGQDIGEGIVLDAFRDAYVTGSTTSGTFPVLDPLQPTLLGTTNAFVTEINPSGSALIYSTFLGGSIDDYPAAIALDSSDDVYITGNTSSTNFPTANPIQPCLGTTACLGANANAFVTEISAFIANTGTGPGISLSQSTLTFASQPVATASPTRTVTLTNTGNAPLTISSVSIGGTNGTPSTVFTQTNNCGSSLASGANCTFSLTFTPSASGAQTGVLTIADNAPASPQSLFMNGNGADFSFALASGGSGSVTVTAGGDASYSLIVAPLGGFTGLVTLTCGTVPTNASCTVFPESDAFVTGSTSVSSNVSVTTQATTSLVPLSLRFRRPPAGWQGTRWRGERLEIGFASITALALFLMTLLKRHRVGKVALGAVLAGALLAGACGGGSSSTTTPAGTYTFTVTASYVSGSGTLNHTVTLTLTVTG